MISELYRQLEEIAGKEIPDIILDMEIILSFSGRARKLRITLIDDTYIDVWCSLDGNYSFHWEQKPIRDKIYRHDNAPHKKWQEIPTYPQHCHDGNHEQVVPSNLSKDIKVGFREFLLLVRKKFVLRNS